MPLLKCDRILAIDWEVWESNLEADRLLSLIKRDAIYRKADRAKASIAVFLTLGDAYLSISWGADSVVMAALAWQVCQELNLRPKAGYVRLDGRQRANPECDLVRDAFFERFHGWDYAENLYFARSSDSAKEQTECYQQLAALLRCPNRYVSGIRAQESASRRIRFQTQGIATKNTCAPLSLWTKAEIFAYTYLEDLPLHPAYAMSGGGKFPRQHLRVASIGGDSGIEFHRRSWETLYYPDLLQAIANEQHALPTPPHHRIHGKRDRGTA